MKELESLIKPKKPASKAIPLPSKPPTFEQLRAMSTDELVKLLMGPDLAKPVNAPSRQQIIRILQEREGNAFVQRLLGKTSVKT